MSFQNLYILIFKKNIHGKTFLALFFFSVIGLFLLAFLLNVIDFTMTNNDLIRKYQLDKINSDDFKTTNTIFVGDSSAGYAINAKYFNELTGLKSKNLSLTGSFGIIGSLGIIKKAHTKNPHIKNIIIINSLHTWPKDYSKDSVLELFNLKEKISVLSISEVISYFLNPKEIFWYFESFIRTKVFYEIDYLNDYLLQPDERFSNGKKTIPNLRNFNVSDGKIRELKMLDNYCKELSLNCIFLNGPIHNKLINNYSDVVKYLYSQARFKHINYVKRVFSYENYKMGDTPHHMDLEHKNESTLDYYQEIKKYLIF